MVRNNKGLTLIEIMITLTIIAMVAGSFLSRLETGPKKFKRELYNFSQIAKRIKNVAKLRNATLRLVIDMGSPDIPENKREHKYWVEASRKRGVSVAEKYDENKKERFSSDKKNEDPEFSPDKSIISQPRQLPSPARFIHVEIAGFDKPITEGKAFIYFLPQGIVDEAVIQISAGKESQWSLVTTPITGRLDIISGAKTLKELEQK